jgi:hypothetical protein
MLLTSYDEPRPSIKLASTRVHQGVCRHPYSLMNHPGETSREKKQ